ncbi:DUF3631 domain-containing protein [Altererythrobacter sp. GH1-8]|uniref:DUF3631 domain-containing protein n=1 Tax=Altererythrobacter sp. GH1-8 TaxID=3349333 RepID=UPI00374CF153
MDAWESTPRIAFLSPEPGSGKTRALEVSGTLVPNAVEAVNVTPAYLFRKVGHDASPPTVLFDEIDTIFGPKAKGNEEIRGLLNAGHRKGAVAGRCVLRGRQIETEELPAYCAVALAGLDELPLTIRTRSILVRMRRRSREEKVEPYRCRDHDRIGHELRDRLAVWAKRHVARLRTLRPLMPDGITDRDADLWEPLLAIATTFGEEWEMRARVAAVTLVTDSKKTTPSIGVRLLCDIRQVFGDKEKMPTVEILEALNSDEEAPWGDWRGKPLDDRKLAAFLRPYGVRPRPIRTDFGPLRGYLREDLHDVWNRYLPELPKPEEEQAVAKEDVTNVTGDTQ